MSKAGDEHMGQYVYCKQHLTPHSTGWCTVSADQKVALKAETINEALAETQGLRLPIWRHCETCYKYIGDQTRYKRYCEDHEQ